MQISERGFSRIFSHSLFVSAHTGRNFRPTRRAHKIAHLCRILAAASRKKTATIAGMCKRCLSRGVPRSHGVARDTCHEECLEGLMRKPRDTPRHPRHPEHAEHRDTAKHTGTPRRTRDTGTHLEPGLPEGLLAP